MRVLPPHLLPHTVRPVASTSTTDAYGNPVQIPGEPGEPVGAYVQPEDTAENPTAGQVREDRWRVYLSPGHPGLDAWSEIEWQGRRYELVGDPYRWQSPDGALDHIRLLVRRVGA